MAKKEEKKAEEKDDKKVAAPEGKEGAEGEATEGAEGGKKKLDKKMIIIIAAAAVLLLGGGAAALVFTGVLGGKKPEAAAADGHGEAAKEDGHGEAKDDGHGGKEDGKKSEHGPIFYDMGEVVVNLQTDGKRQIFLKLVMQLELEAEEDKAVIEKIKPRIIDNFQTYLRELRLDDLRGSAGLYRLREELLFRVTEAAQPVKVKDVLIQQMLVQ
ncbi:MAG: flagellar basal body-associated FliL family protein [Alphaproteobacteria bacterium]|nr:flagellar basal body-associated FliL family protein [Alphaproteobacteria bacterium]